MFRADIGRENGGADGEPGSITATKEIVSRVVLFLFKYPYNANSPITMKSNVAIIVFYMILGN